MIRIHSSINVIFIFTWGTVTQYPIASQLMWNCCLVGESFFVTGSEMNEKFEIRGTAVSVYKIIQTDKKCELNFGMKLTINLRDCKLVIILEHQLLSHAKNTKMNLFIKTSNTFMGSNYGYISEQRFIFKNCKFKCNSHKLW